MTAVHSPVDRDADVAGRTASRCFPTRPDRNGSREAVRPDGGAARRRRGNRTRGDPGCHGSERLGQPRSSTASRDLAPDAGEVRLDGERIDMLGDADRSRLRRTAFGFVFQFGQLVPELPAIENAALPLLLNGRSARPRSRPPRRLERLGLEGLEDRRPGELSGGRPSASRSREPRPADRGSCSPTSRPPARLAGRRAGDEPPHRGREVRGRRSSWSRTSCASRPTPIARSWCATAGSPAAIERRLHDQARPSARVP